MEGRADDYDFKAVDTLFSGLGSRGRGISEMSNVDSVVSFNQLADITPSDNLDEFQSHAVIALVDNPTNTLFKFIHGPPGLFFISLTFRMWQDSCDFDCCSINCQGLVK